VFTVSEDRVAETRPTNFWRMSTDRYADIEQRYDARIARKSVIPESRTAAQAEPHPIQHISRSQRALINCPRCGADNRNWIHIITPPPNAPSARQNGWQNRFPLAIIGLVVGILIVCIGALIVRESSQSTGQTLALLIVVSIGGVIVPVVAITGLWYPQRHHAIEAAQDRTLSWWERISPVARTGAMFFVVFVIVVPFFIYGLMPWMMNRLRPRSSLEDRIDQVLVSLDSTFNTASRQDVVLLENATTTLQSVLSERDFDCRTESISTMIHSLEALEGTTNEEAYNALLLNAIGSLRVLQTSGAQCRPDLVHNAIVNLQALMECHDPACTLFFLPTCGKGRLNKPASSPPAQVTATPMPGSRDCYVSLLTNMISELSVLDDPPVTGSLYVKAKHALEGSRFLALTSANQKEQELIDKQVKVFEKVGGLNTNGRSPDLHAIQRWVLIAGVANLVATAFAAAAVDGFIGRINRHLPAPIGSSIATMSRVVMRDLRHALDIPDESLRTIQWTAVTRSRNGGIKLEGIFLQPNEPDDATSNYVRTQCCYVCTDQWARVIEAEIRYCRIPKLPVHPGRRPESASGTAVITQDDIQDLFLGRPAIPRQGEAYAENSTGG